MGVDTRDADAAVDKIEEAVFWHGDYVSKATKESGPFSLLHRFVTFEDGGNTVGVKWNPFPERKQLRFGRGIKFLA